MQQFRELPEGVLVATDVAARGLDIPDVHCILHFDAPQDPSNFVHRCGRTARMGRSGRAVALLTPQEDVFVELMKQRNVPMALAPAPDGLGTPLVDPTDSGHVNAGGTHGTTGTDTVRTHSSHSNVPLFMG